SELPASWRLAWSVAGRGHRGRKGAPMAFSILGGDLDFSEWGRGLVAAFIGGGAASMAGGFSMNARDPKDYNLGDGLWNMLSLMGTMFLISGLINMALFLRQKPIPDHKVVTTTTKETVVQPTSPPVKVETTKVETHTEPLEPKP